MFDFRTTRVGRFINQNMIGILVAVFSFITVIVVFQILNEGAKEEKRKVTNTATIIQDPSSETVISGVDVSEEKNKENKTVIDSFIEYCNQQKIEEAYNLISADCKKELYPTMERFKELYWEHVFQTSKSYSMQSWISTSNKYTYKVKLLEDMLATGKYDNSKVTEDYFTIVNEADGYKVSINSYVGKEEINKSKNENGIELNVVSKQVYMDYEIYTIQLTNNSDKTILLDSQESFRNAYVLGENNTQYSSYIDEVLKQDLIVDSNETKKIEIKFNKMYNPSISITSIVFSDIIQDYDLYNSNKNEYNGRLQMQIEM